MGGRYSVFSWLRTRSFFSSLIVIPFMWVAESMGKGFYIPLGLRQGVSEWNISGTMLVACFSACLISAKHISLTSCWEQPLLKKTQLLHLLSWIVLASIGALELLLIFFSVKEGDASNINNSSGLEIYLFTLGVCTTVSLRFGSIIGVVSTLFIISLIIFFEQEINWNGVLSDARGKTSYLAPFACVVFALSRSYKSGGHVSRRI